MIINKQVTLTPGTSLNVAQQLGIANWQVTPVYANSVFIQMVKGGTGMGYVMCDIAADTSPVPPKSTTSNVAAQLAAASSTAPGGSWTRAWAVTSGTGIPLNQLWVDGDQADGILLSADIKF